MSALTHWHYVAFAYGAALLVVAGLILSVLLDHRAQTRALRRLEARGVRRLNGYAFAAAIGRLWVGVGGPRARRVRMALARALPEQTPGDHARLTRAVFVHLAQGLVELLALRGPRRQALLDRAAVVGLEF